MNRVISSLALVALASGSAFGAVTSTTSHSTDAFGFEAQLSNSDLIAGQNATEVLGGFHPAVAGGVEVFTDGTTYTNSLNGLLNDFPTVGLPTKVIEYSLGGQDIGGINILSGNEGADGRVFMTAAIYVDGDLLTYVESDQLGTLADQGWKSTFVEISDDSSAVLAAGVNTLRIDFYAVDNSQGQYRDPFEGVNTFTGIDDGLSAAFTSPLIWEVDVVAVPEPASVALLGLAGLALVRRA